MLEGERNRYFSLVSDLQLKATDPAVIADPPSESAFLQAALRGIHTYAAAIVRPSLVLEDASNLTRAVSRARYGRSRRTSRSCARRRRQDFDVVFGAESDTRFAIGSPIAMEGVKIPIDLQKFIERSSGIFGQTGTGKSVLTRLVLFGLDPQQARVDAGLRHARRVRRRQPAQAGHSRTARPVLATEIKVYSLDQRNAAAQYHIRIGLNHIAPEDIELLKDELDLNETFFATSHLLYRAFRDRWLQRLFEMDADGVARVRRELGRAPGCG